MSADQNQPEPHSAPNGDQPTVHHVSARKKRGLPPAKMQLNLTSMIDVIFQLLIYFVVTASFTMGEGVITAKLPQGGATAEVTAKMPKTPLDIVLSSAGVWSVTINVKSRRLNSFSDLQEYLVQLQRDDQRSRYGAFRPDHPIIIKPDGAVRWQHVVNAFNAAVSSRYTNVSFAQATH